LKGTYVSKKLLDFEILHILGRGVHTGYSIRKSLQTVFGTKVSFGTLYPHLEILETSGLIRPIQTDSVESVASIESRFVRRQKIFALTSKGESEYVSIGEDLILFVALIQQNLPRKISALTPGSNSVASKFSD